MGGIGDDPSIFDQIPTSLVATALINATKKITILDNIVQYVTYVILAKVTLLGLIALTVLVDIYMIKDLIIVST